MVHEEDEGYQEIEYELERPTSKFKIIGNCILVACLLLILAWPFTKPLFYSYLPMRPPIKKDVGDGRCIVEHAAVISRLNPRSIGADTAQCYYVDDPLYGQP